MRCGVNIWRRYAARCNARGACHSAVQCTANVARRGTAGRNTAQHNAAHRGVPRRTAAYRGALWCIEAMHCIATQGITTHCDAPRCAAMRREAVHCGATRHAVIQCGAAHCNVLHATRGNAAQRGVLQLRHNATGRRCGVVRPDAMQRGATPTCCDSTQTHCTATTHGTLRCTATRCYGVQRATLQRGLARHTTLPCIALRCGAPHRNALRRAPCEFGMRSTRGARGICVRCEHVRVAYEFRLGYLWVMTELRVGPARVIREAWVGAW